MPIRPLSQLNPKKKYLQLAFNSTLAEADAIISKLPVSDRIIFEVGTPLIKRYGERAIRHIRESLTAYAGGNNAQLDDEFHNMPGSIGSVYNSVTSLRNSRKNSNFSSASFSPYIVADLKTMDRGEAEVEIAARGGANAAIALGLAPIETLNSFIAACEKHGLDPMIDMMNVEFPLSILRSLKKIPPIVILHRGVDEERDNREKQIPLHEIRRIKGNYNIMISVAGGDTIREVQRSIFNDADIVVVWKSVYHQTKETIELVNGFLKQIK